jgi:hypothetical protein
MVGVGKTQYCGNPPCNSGGCVVNDISPSSKLPTICGLTVRFNDGRSGGGNSWAIPRYVGVPRTLFVSKKAGESVLLRLRKSTDHVELVEIR